MANFIGRLMIMSAVTSSFFISGSCLAQAKTDYDQIKNSVERSIEVRKEYREHGGEPGQEYFQKVLEQQGEENLTTENQEQFSKPEIKVWWTLFNGRIKYWQINGQSYLHLG